nr:riboflavin synthase [Desulfonispora thiosulfatigenes]
MFTGLIEEIGVLKSITAGNESLKVAITASEILIDTKLGDSIAVNGVCLTVISFTNSEFVAQVMPETFHKTNLKELKIGEKVNLERALKVGGRLGGHMVSGHVDGLGKVIDIKTSEIAKIFSIEVKEEIGKYLIPKASIAIDGTSLTIVDVKDNYFTVSLIPHTVDVTILGSKRKGSQVNLEVDMMGKYVEKFINNMKKNTKDISLNFLSENGFI